MKKMCVSIALCIVFIFSMIATVSAADQDLIRVAHYKVPLINAIANVECVSGKFTQLLDVEDAVLPGIVMVYVSDVEDVTAFMKNCVDYHMIPTFRAEDIKEAQRVISAVEELSCKDVTVISSDPDVLKFIRNKKVVIRTGLVVALEKDTLTSKEAHAVRTAVRSAPATFCVIDAAVASREVVSELQELAVAVWVEASEGDASIMRAITSGANGVITFDAYNTAVLMNTYFEENTMTRTPVMIGHRGNPTQAPENSLSSFLTAYENGADIFEVDVEITKDGEIIIVHDGTLNRTTTYTGSDSIGSMTLEEVRRYRLLDRDGKPTDETVPTFREVLETFQDKDCRIFIEFKGYNRENVPATLDLVKEYNMEDRVDVISFNSGFLTQTQNEIVGMSTGYLQSPVGYTGTEALALQTLYSSIIDTQAANSSINPNKGVVSDYYLQAATDRGMMVWPWTYSKSTANMAFLQCPDGVTTDDVQWSKEMLKFIETTDHHTIYRGKTIPLSVYGTTYGREIYELDKAQLLVQVIEGKDVVSVQNGYLTALKCGSAQVLLGYKTATTDGSDYVLYTQPVTVTVKLMSPMLLSLIVSAGILLIGSIVVVCVLKKS